jgi:hypothetical protein
MVSDLEIAVAVAAAAYRKHMDDKAGEDCKVFMPDEELHLQHFKAVDLALARFDEIACDGSVFEISQARARAKMEAEKCFKYYSLLNADRKVTPAVAVPDAAPKMQVSENSNNDDLT